MRLPYTKLAPEAYAKLIDLGHYINTGSALDHTLLGLVYLRASQLNGCGFCIGMHTAELLHRHEPQTRIDAVARWQDSDAFTPRERAALAWTKTSSTSPSPSPTSTPGTASASPSPPSGTRRRSTSEGRRPRPRERRRLGSIIESVPLGRTR
jgi:AhpD family alkylhydroperoxidase